MLSDDDFDDGLTDCSLLSPAAGVAGGDCWWSTASIARVKDADAVPVFCHSEVQHHRHSSVGWNNTRYESISCGNEADAAVGV